MIKIERNPDPNVSEDERWVVAIDFQGNGFPQSLTTHKYITDALAFVQSWLSTTVYL